MTKITLKVDLTKIRKKLRGTPLPPPRPILSRKDKARNSARREFRQKTRRES